MRQVCFISTTNHNVGDDFVREGIFGLLKCVLGRFEPHVMHKHFPATTRGVFWEALDRQTRRIPDWGRWRTHLSRMADVLPVDPGEDAVMRSDLVVQSGAPVYWKNQWSTCAQTEWFQPLIRRRWKRHPRAVPLLNLGAGSCQPLGSDGSEVIQDPRCRSFIQEFTGWSALTTVRDELARHIVSGCGHAVPLLPCPSIFAPESIGITPRCEGCIALNYMPYGGHYDLAGGGSLARERWERQFCVTVRKLAAGHRCLLVCHDGQELAEAARLLPEIPRFHHHDWRAYLDAYSRCRVAIVNRVHAAVVTAAMGRRVLLLGNDSRLHTAELVPGITAIPVSEAIEGFPSQVEALLHAPAVSPPGPWLAEMKSRYLKLLRPVLLT